MRQRNEPCPASHYLVTRWRLIDGPLPNLANPFSLEPTDAHDFLRHEEAVL